MAWSQESKINSAVWEGGRTYSLSPVNDSKKVYSVHNGLTVMIRMIPKNENIIQESICTSMVILIISEIVLKINEAFWEGREAHPNGEYF